MDPNKFRQKTRETLAKRAGQMCSNPNCNQSTTGPHSDSNKHVDVGEAAHIKGAHPRPNNRYDSSMSPEERRSITNGIWLCRTCAKLIDSDQHVYAVEKLYEWKRTHEEKIRIRVEGKQFSKISEEAYTKFFKDESPAAQQIVIDKPKDWEYLLTIQLLRDKLPHVQKKLKAARSNMSYRPVRTIADRQILRLWFQNKTNLLRKLINLLAVVITPYSRNPASKKYLFFF